jgi:hypothetical protein
VPRQVFELSPCERSSRASRAGSSSATISRADLEHAELGRVMLNFTFPSAGTVSCIVKARQD